MGRKLRRALQVLLGPSNGEMSPWDRGALEAHWMGSVRTQRVLERQARARKQRRGLLARIWPPRRRYLDGLLWGIEGELKRRGKDES